MNSYNITHNVCSPTRIYNNLSSETIKFLSTIQGLVLLLSSTVNGLSDHDARYLILKMCSLRKWLHVLTYGTREGSKDSISNFQELIKFETWANIYKHDDINIIFNSILNNLLFFNLVFPFTIQP
jgi:hypothetical protein